MTTAMKSARRGRAALAAGVLGLPVLALVLLCRAGPVAAAGTAAATPAHAKLTGSVPAAGATVDRAPDAVTLTVDAKPATTEGDPLRVYGPDGHRVDDGRTSVGDHGRRIAVGLRQNVVRPAGPYEIVYRIVSRDTHLIAGRLEFTARTAVAPAAILAGKDAGRSAGVRSRLLHGWPEDARPLLAAAVAVTLVMGRLAWRRRPGARPDRRRPVSREDRRRSTAGSGRPTYRPGAPLPHRPVPTDRAHRSPDFWDSHARTR